MTDNVAPPNMDDIERYKNRHGAEKTSRILSSLGKDRQFMSAWESPAGKEIMTHLLSMADNNLDAIINENSDEKMRAEFRVCMSLLRYVQDRINNYQRNLHKLKEE